MIGEQRVFDHLLEQAGWCEGLGSPFTAALFRRMAQDLEAGGIVHRLLNDWEGNPRKDALGLRLTGALHYLVLSGKDPALAHIYPEKCPDWDIETVWKEAARALTEHDAIVSDMLSRPPQTNETRRSIALLPGFLTIAHRFNKPLHLLELGASAGLNQNWDKFSYQTDSWAHTGPSDVVIRTDWNGPPPAHLDEWPIVAARAACDLSPIDVSDEEAALRLKSYVWADQDERLARLDAAVALARSTNVNVEQGDAADWLEQKLANRPDGVVTVVFHSVFLIYPPKDVIARIKHLIHQAGESATRDSPVAWLCYEPESLFGGDKTSPKMKTRLQIWPDGEAKDLIVSDGHVTRLQVL